MNNLERSLRVAEATFLQQPPSPERVYYGSRDAQLITGNLPSYMAQTALHDTDYATSFAQDARQYERTIALQLELEQKQALRQAQTATDTGELLEAVKASSDPTQLTFPTPYTARGQVWGEHMARATNNFLRTLPEAEMKEAAAAVRGLVYNREPQPVNLEPPQLVVYEPNSKSVTAYRAHFTLQINRSCLKSSIHWKRYDKRLIECVDEKAKTIHSILNPGFYRRGKQAYDAEVTYHGLTSQEGFAEEILEIMDTVGIESHYGVGIRSENMMTDGNQLFQRILTEAGSRGSANAPQLVELLRKQGNSSFLSPVRLANALLRQLNNVIVDKDGKEITVEELPEKPLNVPDAYFRILYIAQELGQGVDAISEEDKEKFRLLTQIAGKLFIGGFDKKAEQPVLTVGDVVMRFPDANARQISDILDQLEQGSSIDKVQMAYRDARQRYGKHVYWNKHTAGYGVLS